MKTKISEIDMLRAIALTTRDRIIAVWIAGTLQETRQEMTESLRDHSYFGRAGDDRGQLNTVILRLNGIAWQDPPDIERAYPLSEYHPLYRRPGWTEDEAEEGGEAV